MDNNLFKFAKRKNNHHSPTIHQNSSNLFWKRFFSKKINIFSIIAFFAILLIIIIALLFINNSPTKQISDVTYVNNLPSWYSQIISRNFEKGEELNFIRKMAEISKNNSLGEKPVFEILYDSAFDSIGDTNKSTDIVTLYYNPYDLLKAINLYTNEKIKVNKLILGTNENGIDIYSRLFSSIIITLLILTSTTFINIYFGFILGAITSLNPNKWYSKVIDSLSIIIHSLPEIIWIFVLTVFIGNKWWSLLIIFSMISWTSFYELSKNEIHSLNNTEFIISLKSVGLTNFQIIHKHLFKKLLPSFLIMMTEKINSGILIITSLVFLEFINPNNSLNIGSVLMEAINSVQTNSLYLIVLSIVIIWFSLSLKLFSNSLSNTYNPKI